MRRTFIAFFIAGALVAACSKENNITQNNSTGGDACTADNTAGCGVGAVCVLGKCRNGCTNDAECPQGSICVGDRAPFGCTTPDEGKCSGASPCPSGLVCGVDAVCRIPCAEQKACPRNEQICIAGACVSKSEENFGSWACDNPEGNPRYGPVVRFDDGVTQACNVVSRGWAEVDSCADQAYAFATVFVLPSNNYEYESPYFACPARDACQSGRYFCRAADLSACESDPKCGACRQQVAEELRTCRPSANPLPSLCQCVTGDVLPCALDEALHPVPRAPVDCKLKLPDGIDVNGTVIGLSRDRPLLLSVERILALGQDYSIEGDTVTLTPAACALAGIEAFVCGAKCPSDTCTDVAKF